MAGYSPLRITGMSVGLVQQREEFLLPDDAYPNLQNAYVWRERIKRKRGYQLLGRLQRNIGTTNNLGNNTGISITPIPINPGIATFQIGTDTFTDAGGVGPLVTLLSNNLAALATLNRTTGVFKVTGSVPLTAIQYFPGLPVMGLRILENANSENDTTVAFDQCYAYTFNSGLNQWQEFIAGTTWNAHNASPSGVDFFWSTNYWISYSTPNPFNTPGNKLFWVTNNTGQYGTLADPPRITDGISWVNFDSSTWNQIDATTLLFNFLCMLPYRGRMVTFNTYEGPTKASAVNYSNRIRWSTIGNPFIPYSAGPPAKGSWRDDIRGQGGFLDIPTSEDIVSVGFVRDNLVIYCERSTWQLRYTGRSISPFQIERVNSELGVEGTFSSVQFDTSLVGIGDKGIVECDSYKSERIDIKIPDFVFQFNSTNSGPSRVQGIRDFVNRLAYWTVPIAEDYDPKVGTGIFPNQRLVYNYENDSWALFNDSLTCLGTYQAQSSRTWLNTPIPWIECNFPWINQPQADPLIVAGNQQGFVEILNELTVNDVSLYIQNIVGYDTTPTIITSPNHNMSTDFVVKISGIPPTSNFSNLNTGINPNTGLPYNANNGVFGIIVNDANTFQLMIYNTVSQEFSTPQLDPSGQAYNGLGYLAIVENFSIISKKFNFLDEGQSIQLGYLDILMDSTENTNPGAISLNVYLDYDDINVSNKVPQNDINNGSSIATPDTFFNSIIPTTQSTTSNIRGTKFWQRVYCATRANFLTLEYTFSNAQLAGEEQQQDIQIDAQVLWIRRAGRLTQP
jgi:hypothetical protein